jgi:hypothetical protein
MAAVERLSAEREVATGTGLLCPREHEWPGYADRKHERTSEKASSCYVECLGVIKVRQHLARTSVA